MREREPEEERKSGRKRKGDMVRIKRHMREKMRRKEIK